MEVLRFWRISEAAMICSCREVNFILLMKQEHRVSHIVGWMKQKMTTSLECQNILKMQQVHLPSMPYNFTSDMK